MVTFDERNNYKRKADPKSHIGLAGLNIRLCDLKDVCEIIAHGKYPNASFGDDECTAWEVIVHTLGIDVRN